MIVRRRIARGLLAYSENAELMDETGKSLKFDRGVINTGRANIPPESETIRRNADNALSFNHDIGVRSNDHTPGAACRTRINQFD
jgi:hypothetical protein